MWLHFIQNNNYNNNNNGNSGDNNIKEDSSESKWGERDRGVRL